MKRKLLIGLGVCLMLCTASLAQEPEAAPAAPASVPAASDSEMNCAGFVGHVSRHGHIFDGADNDFRVPSHQFVPGDFVYVHGNVKVDTEYAVVRPADKLFSTSWYPRERFSLWMLGQPYEDVGRVRVASKTSHGAVAEVIFACGPLAEGDIVATFQGRAVPDYIPGTNYERFAPAKDKQTGTITAAHDNLGYIGAGHIAYINLGRSDGVQAGQRFRIFQVTRDRVAHGGWRPFALFSEPPRETIGELVVLFTEKRASSAMVVSSIREIAVGDRIEAE